MVGPTVEHDGYLALWIAGMKLLYSTSIGRTTRHREKMQCCTCVCGVKNSVSFEKRIFTFKFCLEICKL